jgi:hypothetical protein
MKQKEKDEIQKGKEENQKKTQLAKEVRNISEFISTPNFIFDHQNSVSGKLEKSPLEKRNSGTLFTSPNRSSNSNNSSFGSPSSGKVEVVDLEKRVENKGKEEEEVPLLNKKQPVNNLLF